MYIVLCLRWSLWWKYISAFPTCFDVRSFCCSKCRNISTSFWISLKGDWFTCSCLFSVFMGRGKVRSLLFCHLADDKFSLFKEILFVFGVLQLHYNMCKHEFPFIHVAWELLGFLAMKVGIFHQSQKFLVYFFILLSSAAYIRIFLTLTHPPCILTAF